MLDEGLGGIGLGGGDGQPTGQMTGMGEPTPQHMSTAMVAWVEPQPPPTPPPPTPPAYVTYPYLFINPHTGHYLRPPHQIAVQVRSHLIECFLY